MTLRALAVLGLTLAAAGCCRSLSTLTDSRYLVSPAPGNVSYTPPAARYEVDEAAESWTDAARSRQVPVRIYTPRNAPRPWPLIVFSHGIGESRDSYPYFARAWAARGYAVVNVTHHGTDRDVLAQGWLTLYRAAKNPENWRNRPLDVRFVLDRLLADPRFDPSRVAVAGHSAGAFTALAAAGMEIGGTSMRDLRVKAVVAMSMPLLDGSVAPDYAKLAAPVLNMTGTCDGSLIYHTHPKDRRQPFERTARGDQYLVTFEGANHNVFSDPQAANNREIHERIALISVVFLDAYLQGDAAAKRWLDGGGLSRWRGLALEKK